ncbi:hypothetical protein [Paenibacillus popilliae]|uniref:hypothetical protein n=1 Tax=Paenibacillus popilliae TaxID=78057 RepID=UPI0011D23CCD|nr:hypothetical protein [Paenibacillus popilliae]
MERDAILIRVLLECVPGRIRVEARRVALRVSSAMINSFSTQLQAGSHKPPSLATFFTSARDWAVDIEHSLLANPQHHVENLNPRLLLILHSSCLHRIALCMCTLRDYSRKLFSLE